MIRRSHRFRNHLDDHLVHLQKNLYISPSDPLYFEKVVRYLDPNSPEAHFKLGQKYQASGNLNRAMFHYKQVLKTYPSPFYSAANRAIHDMEKSPKLPMPGFMETAAAKERLLPPFMKTLLLVLLVVNLLLIALFFGDRSISKTVPSMMKWGVGSSVTYETVDVPYVMYLTPEMGREQIEKALHQKALELGGNTPDQNIIIYGMMPANANDAGKTAVLTNEELTKNAFVIAQYYPISDQSVKIRFLNAQYQKHQPLSALGANFIRTALSSYKADHGELPESLGQLLADYPNNYISYIPLEAQSGSNTVKGTFDGQGGWVFDPAADTMEGAFYANVPGGMGVPYSPMHVEISKAQHRLLLVSGTAVLWEKEVGLGANDSTPEGSFHVLDRALAPSGSREGVYGAAGLGLGAIALHGTYDESSIGHDKSLGCVRLSNEDIQQLYHWIPKGTEVQISANPSLGGDAIHKEDQQLDPSRIVPAQLPQADETPEHVIFHWLG